MSGLGVSGAGSSLSGVLGRLPEPFAPGALGGLDGAAGSARQRDFAEVMSIADRGAAGAASRLADAAEPEAAARDAAERFVSMAFLQPLLAEFRASSDAAPPFHRTAAEKQFGSLVDAQVAVGIVRASDWPIVDRLAQQMLRRSGAGAAAGSSVSATGAALLGTGEDGPSLSEVVR